jgi:dTDP-glucose 4,6-dehydratase
MTPRLRGLRVLVTGADGFIGSQLVEALVREGTQVRAMVFYNSLNSWGWLDDAPDDVRGQFEVVTGDIRDPHFMHEVVRGCEVVLHLAALISIPFSYRSPAAFVDTNVMGTVNVLQAARDSGVARVVCTSTSEVYGSARRVPIDEDHPLQAQSPYAASKIAADQMALAFHRTYGTPVVVLRPFNTFGPRQSARAVIPTIITQIASGVREIKLGALSPRRDFSFVSDTVRGFLRAAVAERGVGEVINTGAGFEISIGDTAREIARIMQADVEIARVDERVRPAESEVDRLWANIDKAARELGWTPEYAGRDGFRRGLEETVSWFRQSDHLKRYKPAQYSI